MKKSIIIAFLAVTLVFTFNACSNSTPAVSGSDSKTSEKQLYTCSMHPEVQTDRPGNCPKCGMALIKKETSDSTRLTPNADSLEMK